MELEPLFISFMVLWTIGSIFDPFPYKSHALGSWMGGLSFSIHSCTFYFEKSG
jgi:hypothetical protein